jgi:hypothetical protein
VNHDQKHHSFFIVRTNEGAYDLEAALRFVGNDLLVAIYGGEKPHIGAVAVAQVRPSRNDAAIPDSTVSILCLLGHKEDEIAKNAAKKLSLALNTTVTVTAGIHWDDISREGIDAVIKNSEILVDRVIAKIQNEFPQMVSHHFNPASTGSL